MKSYQAHKSFFVDARTAGRPTLPRTMAFAGTRPELVESGDVIEQLPGGLFLTKRGTDERIQLVKSNENHAQISAGCFRIAG